LRSIRIISIGGIMSEKLQISGWATVINSKKYSEEDCKKILEAPEGYHAELKFNISNSMQGKLKRNKNTGSIACHFAVKTSDCEVVIVPDKDKKGEDSLKKSAESLL
jgi:hypothetical protein